MTKRALSLDDLVNHDENDKTKLQKMGEQLSGAPQVLPQTQPPVRKTSIEISDINNAEDTEVISRPEEPVRKESNFNMGQQRNILNDEPTPVPVVKPEPQAVPAVAPVSHTPGAAAVEQLVAPAAKPAVPQQDDETDTDDEVDGSGEINFDSGMAFDYEKQDNNSPQKASNARSPKKVPSESKISPKTETAELSKAEEPVEKEPSTGASEKESVAANGKEEEDTKKPSVKNIFEEKTSTESKRNNIKKDLEVLNEISAVTKPNKYKNVPAWAKKWRPTVNALQNIDTSDFKIDSSFLNIIPDDDLTKSVQDWVYATIYSIDPDLRQFIELEMKFGLIVEAKSPERVSPPIASQAVYTELDAHMTPNVDEVLFKELNKYIRGISEMTENSGKFNIIESLTKDSVYRVGLSTQRPRFLRMSRDVQTGRVAQFIEKRHISQLLLLSPKDSYDMKISLNLELPVPENDPPEKYQNQTPVSERTKDRVSYIHNDSCTRIDVTTVQNHNQGVKGRHTEVTHEIELEINTPALLTAFDKIATDSKEYASVIRTFLNNGTIIRRKLSSLSYQIFEGNKK
ncbi:polynucleotide 5'-phosphatase [Maudiozyma humilis]|uniref:mRNA-capping enzyme subunit beta n=1 Tax=Maudiozyma humilis TaxID=51915 RepID=A0AAV5RXB3_MAUHU|nr:polynucleotide 5'-phosphatase [Kazachstania humilis]